MTNKTQQKFAIDENRVFLFTQQEGAVVDALPPAYYKIKNHPMLGLFLQNMGEKLPVPAELYGSTEKRATKVINTFNRKEQGIGVALFGSKGAGKTLLSNVIANKALDQGLPVIDISGINDISSGLLNFINSIGQCVLIFDEFLKALSKVDIENTASNTSVHEQTRIKAHQAQENLLTFFSGTNNAKRLTILIDNQASLLNEYFLDRPSRLRYVFNYESVEADVVRQLAKKHDLSEKLTDELVTYSARKRCTFDMINELLDEIVHETDLENVSLAAITKHFNVPTQVEATIRKLRVAEHKMATHDNYKFVLADEIVSRVEGKTFVGVNITPTWDVNAVAEFKDSDSYYSSCKYDDYFSYEVYAESFKTKELPVRNHRTVLTYRELQGIKGNASTYRKATGTFTIVDDVEPPVVNEFDYF